jgi:putative MATE family efflux protein
VVPFALVAPLLFAAFGHEAPLQGLETTYFRIRMAHVLGTGTYAALSSFFQGIGRPKIPMYAALVANLFNAVLDAFLIFGVGPIPAMGIAGAALATALASYFQSVLLLGAFLWGPLHARFRTRDTWRFDWARFKRLLNIGAPAGASFSLHVASWAIFTNLLIGKLGRDILAANNVCHSILGLSFMPAVGLNKGITVLVGQYIGKRQIPAAKRRAYVGIGLAMVYMGLCGLIFVLFRRPIIRLFHAAPTIVETGSRMLILAAIFQAFDALGIISHGALRGAGDTKVPAIVDIAAGWFLLLPLGYVLTFPLGWGYVGAWTAAAVQIATVGIIFFARFVSEAWRKIDIFAGVEPAVAQASAPLPPSDDHPTPH